MKQNVLVLFDIDGTLTPPRGTASNEIIDLIERLRNYVYVGVVGGSDLIKQQEQLGNNVLEMFDYDFPENGLVAYKNGLQIHNNSIINYLGEERYKTIINYVLKYISECDIPIKRGTFVELRTGLINISIIGRNCSLSERNDYEKYDLKNKVRQTLIDSLKQTFSEYNLKYSIGGQISFDVFPQGWDKTYCLKHIKDMNFKEIHFFGDKTNEGGNDFEIYNDKRVIGHNVNSVNDTIEYIKKMLSELENAFGKNTENNTPKMLSELENAFGKNTENNTPNTLNKQITCQKTSQHNIEHVTCKDGNGNIFKLSPEIWDFVLGLGFGIITICPNCKTTELSGDYNGMKDCDNCDKTVCIKCVGLTGCQTKWGICNKCFNYKCRECSNDLNNKNICYLDDDEPLNMCDSCLKKMH